MNKIYKEWQIGQSNWIDIPKVKEWIEKYFHKVKEGYLPDVLKLENQSILAKNDLHLEPNLGLFKGNAFSSFGIVHDSNDKIKKFQLGKWSVFVDAKSKSHSDIKFWAMLVKHKWNWPYNDIAHSMPPFWSPFFSNVKVDSLTTEMNVSRTIWKGDELFIDFSLDSWESEEVKIKPDWDLTNSVDLLRPVDFQGSRISLLDALGGTDKTDAIDKKLKKLADASYLKLDLQDTMDIDIEPDERIVIDLTD